MAKINIYPFVVDSYDVKRLFIRYVVRNPKIFKCDGRGDRSYIEQYGRMIAFSWYEVDMVVRSPTDVTFRTYDMECPQFGGRGDREFEIEFSLPAQELSGFIEQRQTRAAEEEFDRRAAEARKKAIMAVHEELFDERPWWLKAYAAIRRRADKVTVEFRQTLAA
jgi:hypothetical protein